ncbi:AAA family ATPase [Candidatus Actinomarina]|nr:AAA family ATPase [Candidatus Actinomarina sp.]
MYLKSLDINGFKSFSEKTIIDFSNEVNVIVGPNGSGKSNVVDAISWVLGTQSPATLRTNKMEDVIFAGTEKLSAKGYSEVYLNFEVDEQLFNGNSEISIGRKLFRDGTSEYFMNGLNCRLLDIQEFLNDVGIGKQQHIIISQGQIAEILNSKPEDHRLTIEEAAGILPLRSKKEKSLKRIESGEKEIKRAKDVLREIKKQLKPLREQAEQARIHEEKSNLLKIKMIELNIFLFKKYKNLDNQQDTQEKEINTSLNIIDKKILDLKNQKSKINTELGDGVSIGSTLKDYSSKFLNISEQLRSIAQVASERKDNLERDEIKAVEELSKINKKIKVNSEQISNLSSQLISKKLVLGSLQESYKQIKFQLEDIIKKLSASTEVNEALLQSEISQLNNSISDTTVNLNNLNSDLKKWENDLSESEKLIDNINEEIFNSDIILESVPQFINKTKSILNREVFINNNKLTEKENSHKDLVQELTIKENLLDSLNQNEQFKNDINNQKKEFENQIIQIENEISAVSNQLISSQERIKSLTEQNDDLNKIKNEISLNASDVNINNLSNLIKSIMLFIEFSNKTSDTLETKALYFDDKYGNSNKKLSTIDEQIDNLNKEYFSFKESLTNIAIKRSEYKTSKSQHYSNLTNIYGLTIEEINNYYLENESQEILQNEIKSIEHKLEEIGTVNYLAKEDYELLNNRFEDITSTIEDLSLAKKELLENINEIEKEIEFQIESSFNSISVHFSEIFETLFPGGNGSLSFTDKSNILETGIEISVQPRGKKVKKLSLLSGGERSLAAIAFLFSIFKSFPSPFYILDEVEAALDDANLHRMINLLKHVKNDAQYIIVTHQQQTMHAGDILYGVTMEPGSGSRVFTKTKKDFESMINTK